MPTYETFYYIGAIFYITLRRKKTFAQTAILLTLGASIAIFGLEKIYYKNTLGFSLQRAGQTAAAVAGAAIVAYFV